MEQENHFLRYLHIINNANTAKIYLPLKRPKGGPVGEMVERFEERNKEPVVFSN